MPVVVTVKWLEEYVPGLPEPQEVASRLTDVGLAVDAVQPLEGGDTKLVLDVPANRGDCWSVLSLARELAAVLGRTLNTPPAELATSGEAASKEISVEVEEPFLCPRYTARLIRGIEPGPSPEWIRRRLEAVGTRPISSVVDVTNYVMCEWGQPLHAFDMSLLRGGKIIVRRAREGEELALLDGTKRKLCGEDLVIADTGRAIALAGVMGGAETEIGPSTRDVLLESAQFDPVSIRRTARRLGVPTESSVRFEHGVDPVGVELASRRAAFLLAAHAGGEVAPGLVDSNPDVFAPRTVRLRRKQIRRLLGGSVPKRTVEKILRDLGLELVSRDREETLWRVPSWRQDLSIEADLIEEVARVYGYDRLPGRPTMRVFPVKPHPALNARRRARDVLTGLGYTEARGASFFPEHRASFGWTRYADSRPSERTDEIWSGAQDGFRILNPVRAHEDTLRTSLVPSLLAAKLTNQNAGRAKVRLFEVAPVCKQPFERLAVLDDGTEQDDTEEKVLLRAKGTIEVLADRLGGKARPEFRRLSYGRRIEGLDCGRSAEVIVAERTIGFVGILEPNEPYPDVKGSPAIVELDIEALAGERVPQAKPLPRFPGIARDVAIVVAEETSWAKIEETVLSLRHEWRSPPVFLEVYDGEPIPTGRKSILFRVTYRSPDRTLADEDVKAPHEDFVEKLCAALGAHLRK